MSREIRITIDDDEVFERMKRRKRELDLSWAEVLHRGLRRSPDEESGWGDRGRGGWRSHGDPMDDFSDQLERQIKQKVMASIQSSVDAFGPDVGGGASGGLDDEVAALTEAEDAVLVFDDLADDPASRVPLRVTMQTSRDGLDVEVVAVRQGKNVEHMNTFEKGARRQLTRHLAGGGLATLSLDDGVEEYRVAPVLSWSRDERGRPVVTDVSIDEVSFDDER
ncbi:hypothetical protein ACFQH6_05380 [Halobacteriaceae archaeon GCM10025711]